MISGLVVSMIFNSERDATNAGVGTINALFMLCGMCQQLITFVVT